VILLERLWMIRVSRGHPTDFLISMVHMHSCQKSLRQWQVHVGHIIYEVLPHSGLTEWAIRWWPSGEEVLQVLHSSSNYAFLIYCLLTVGRLPSICEPFHQCGFTIHTKTIHSQTSAPISLLAFFPLLFGLIWLLGCLMRRLVRLPDKKKQPSPWCLFAWM
jgi:hypothetical protein